MSLIYSRLQRTIEQGLTPAIATIIRVKGSVPREVGAKMLIHPLGQHVGTVGGGCGEADVIRTGLDVIQDGQPRIVQVDLTDPITMQSPGVCGGVMDVFVERPMPTSTHLLVDLADALGRRDSVALLTVCEASGECGGALGDQCVIWLNEQRAPAGDLAIGDWQAQAIADGRNALSNGESRLVRYANDRAAVTLFIEALTPPPHLIIAGAGHIAGPLAAIAKTCDFVVTVLDDRGQYAQPARFPSADRVIAGPFRDELRSLRADRPEFDPRTCLVLVTRGHQYDIDCLLEVLDDPLAYIGMIGSQRRVRAVFDLLEQERAIPANKFDRIHAPIGLDIGARTPAEIAVCIMAEIINVLRNGPAVSLSEQVRGERQARREKAQQP